MKRRFAGALLLSIALLGLASPSAAASPDDEDWISATSALVNRLGGVSIIGQASCTGSYAALIGGELQYQDEEEQWLPIPVPEEGDEVIMLVNPDSYTVNQPAGRKTMIQVSHGSSRLAPCYATTDVWPDGSPVACEQGGAPCRWVTDEYGYDHDAFGPLFDYSPNGKFKAGLLSIRVKPIGRVVMVAHAGGSVDWYSNPYGFDVVFNAPITAVNYR